MAIHNVANIFLWFYFLPLFVGGRNRPIIIVKRILHL